MAPGDLGDPWHSLERLDKQVNEFLTSEVEKNPSDFVKINSVTDTLYKTGSLTDIPGISRVISYTIGR